MQFGQIEKFVVTSKKFMVNTDHHALYVQVIKSCYKPRSTITPEEQQGEAYLELFVPLRTRSQQQQVAFNVKAEENQTISFEFTAPKNMDLLGCRIASSSIQRWRTCTTRGSRCNPSYPDLPIFTHQQGQHSS